MMSGLTLSCSPACYGALITSFGFDAFCFQLLHSWTLVYDTEYACQDWKDDLKAGVKSTALLFGKHVRGVLTIFAMIFLAMLVVAGVMNEHGVAFYVVACGGAACHFIWQFSTWDIDDHADCGMKFKVSATCYAST